MNCKILYRISSESLNKPRLPGATKLRCLDNFSRIFGKDINIIADNCDDNLLMDISRRELPTMVTSLGNSQSFLFALSQVRHYPDDTLVYFVEDDYLHLPAAPMLLREGIQVADYITLYDHPDKYGPLYEYAEQTKVYRTPSSHWRWTASTCMTFASTAKILKQDMEAWAEFCSEDIPRDHDAFCNLRVGHGRTLAVAIPGAACHTDLTHSIIEGVNLMEPWAINMLIRDVEQTIYKSWDGDAIEVMEEVMHHQKHEPLELLTLLSQIEYKMKKASKP